VHNPNLIGGDIIGGSNAVDQFIARPFPRWNPYTTSIRDSTSARARRHREAVYMEMRGYWAARTALRRMFSKDVPEQLAG
jgi:hypothetical protein